MHELPCFNRLWHTAAVLSADLGNMMKTARRWVCSLLVYWLVNRLLKPALKPQFFSSLRIKKTWLPGMLGNPREEQKTHQPARSHTSSTSSQSGEGSVLHLRHWLQSSNQRTHSELQYDSSWAGKHRPPLLRLLLRLLLSIQLEVFITTTSHIPFKVTHSLRERLVILISTSDSLSLCVSQMQAESWCLFNALFNRRVEWVRSHQAAGLQQIKVPFIFFLPGGCSRLFKAAQGCSRQFLTLGWVLNSCCVIRTNNETLCWNNYGSFYNVGDCL